MLRASIVVILAVVGLLLVASRPELHIASFCGPAESRLASTILLLLPVYCFC
jgi:hypothetical protein